MSKEPVEYLKHIRDECYYLNSVIGDDLSKEDFLRDETMKRAVVRSLEIIGEATKKIPADCIQRLFALRPRRKYGTLESVCEWRSLYTFSPLRRK